jgi:hypothetical protein
MRKVAQAQPSHVNSFVSALKMACHDSEFFRGGDRREIWLARRDCGRRASVGREMAFWRAALRLLCYRPGATAMR